MIVTSGAFPVLRSTEINPDNSSRRRFLDIDQRDIPNWVSVARVGLTVKDFVNPTRYHRAIPSWKDFPEHFAVCCEPNKWYRATQELVIPSLAGRRLRFLGNDLTCRQVDLILIYKIKLASRSAGFTSHSNTSDQENRSSKRRSYSILHSWGTGLHLVVHRAPLLVPGTPCCSRSFFGSWGAGLRIHFIQQPAYSVPRLHSPRVGVSVRIPDDIIVYPYHSLFT